MGSERPLHVGHMRVSALRPSGYDFTTLYTLGGTAAERIVEYHLAHCLRL